MIFEICEKCGRRHHPKAGCMSCLSSAVVPLRPDCPNCEALVRKIVELGAEVLRLRSELVSSTVPVIRTLAETEAVSDELSGKRFDKASYQRELMRCRRADEKATKIKRGIANDGST